MKKENPIKSVIKIAAFCFVLHFLSLPGYCRQDTTSKPAAKTTVKNQRFFYGLASYYSNKFHGRQTANGEIFNQNKLTAACNILPLGTWIRVTNLKNGKSVVVRTTDRLHPRMRRLVDLSRAAAKKLNYIDRGLTRVKIEVLSQKPK